MQCQTVSFRHVPSGEIRTGLLLGMAEGWRHVALVLADNRVLAVHTDNIIS